jgi:hypothetical protein
MMNVSNCEYLIGISISSDDCIRLDNTPEAVAAFICDAGQYGEVAIAAPDFNIILSAFCMSVDRCDDQAFLRRLLPVLVPLQRKKTAQNQRKLPKLHLLEPKHERMYKPVDFARER